MEHEVGHVCGGLPVSVASLWITRCHHHEAITVRAELIVQLDEEPYVSSQHVIAFGPFDSHEQISEQCAALAQQFVAALQLPNEPPAAHTLHTLS